MFAHDMHDEFAGEFRGFGGLRAGRIGRGMIEPAILRTLLDKPMHGYEIISTLEDKSHGFWRPSAGSVYPTLQLLEEKGFVLASDADGKKVYTLTAEGQAEAHKTNDFVQHWGDQREGPRGRHDHRSASFQEMRDMRELMGLLMRDMRTIYRKGSEKQRTDMYTAVKNLRNTLQDITQENKND